MLLSDKNYTANNTSHSEYSNYDKEIVFNDSDPVLKPIPYKLPTPPKLRTIANFGLPPNEQYFRHEIIPPKLVALQKEKIGDSAKVEKLEANPDYYSEEIAFIERQWERGEKGYWFYNNGKPTYITGLHYLFLNFWSIKSAKNKFPFFCMYDREVFLFFQMCLEDPNCFGFNFPKHRRAGATSIATCIRYFRAIMNPIHHSGLQSMDEDSAEMIHENHMTFAWQKMVFWFRPIYDGIVTRTSSIKFSAPRFKNSDDYGKDALDSRITYGASSETHYDGDILNTIHSDEVGKTLEADIYQRWRVQKPALKSGTDIIGIAMNTSTVEEMESKGGGVINIAEVNNFNLVTTSTSC